VTAHLPKTTDPSRQDPRQNRGAFARLVDDARDLVPRGEAAVWWALAGAVLLQTGFWYFGSPGPSLLDEAPRTLTTALRAVGWTAGLLLLAPLLIWWGIGRPFSALGLRLGDWRLGLPVAVGLAAVSAPVLWLVSGWPDFRATYPWPGAWAGAAPGNLAAWAGIYLIYYLAFELFYRGFLLRLLEPVWGLRAALWLQAICATLVHLGKPLPETIIALPASLVLGLIAVRTRSLFWPVLLHFAIGLITDIASLSHQGWLFP
jgi:membrane protease YdiL (CAAX protease family)